MRITNMLKSNTYNGYSLNLGRRRKNTEYGAPRLEYHTVETP